MVYYCEYFETCKNYDCVAIEGWKQTIDVEELVKLYPYRYKIEKGVLCYTFDDYASKRNKKCECKTKFVRMYPTKFQAIVGRKINEHKRRDKNTESD